MATNNADWMAVPKPPHLLRGRKPVHGGMARGQTPLYSTVEFIRALDEKLNVTPVEKILLHLDDVVLDLTDKYEGGALIEQVKENAPDHITSGDMQLTFINTDDSFSEFKSTSLLYQKKYHARKLEFYAGFRLPDGSSEYRLQATMRVTGIEFSSTDSSFIISCQDYGRRLLDTTVNLLPADSIPAARAGNTGNGTCSKVAVMPFAVANETFTLTCTLAGGDSTATFSVVGSSSGSLGTATSGSQFSTGSKVKFAVRAGSLNWAIGDVLTFVTYAPIQFSAENPIKMIWALLTGYDFDTGAAKTYAAQTPQFDNTRGFGNSDLDWQSFGTAAKKASFALKGWLPFETNLVEALEEIILTFLGSIYITEAGKVALTWFKPDIIKPELREFSDTKKTVSFKYRRETGGFAASGFFCNYATCEYKAQDSWDWTDENFQYDGFYVAQNEESIGEFDRFAKSFQNRYYAANADHVHYFVDRVVGRFLEPPLVAEAETGADGFTTQLGDQVRLTDSKAGLSQQLGEVIRLQKDYSVRPRNIGLSVLFEQDAQWGFLGSSVDEGDGESPQAENYADASEDNKRFVYLAHGQDPSVLYVGDVLPENADAPWTLQDSSSSMKTPTDRVLVVDISSGNLYWEQGASSDWGLNAKPNDASVAFGFRVKVTPLGLLAASGMHAYMQASIKLGTTYYRAWFNIFADAVQDGSTGKNYPLRGMEAPGGTSFHDYWCEFVDQDTYAFYMDGKRLFTEQLSIPSAGNPPDASIQFGITGGTSKLLCVDNVWYRTTSPSVDDVPYRLF